MARKSYGYIMLFTVDPEDRELEPPDASAKIKKLMKPPSP
jgi:hypothetical protein